MNTINTFFGALAAGTVLTTGLAAQGVTLRPLTGVNTGADEWAARPDGEALTFVRVGGHAAAYAPGLRWLGFDRADAGAHAAAAPTLTASYELDGYTPVSASASARGEGVAMARKRLTPSGRAVEEIALARRGTLDYLAAYDFPYNDTRFNSTDPALHADGRRMIFASDRPGGYGGYDLYYSEHGADGWSAPVNLGPDVNSAANELACFWGAAGLISFASDRAGGLGGLDLYTVDASGPTWGAARHLGLPYNTESDDTYLAYDRETGRAVLASNRPGGRGGFDVYAFDLPADGARELAWLPAYAPAAAADYYSAREEAFASAEASLRQLRRTGDRGEVTVGFELTATRGVATALAQDLALGYGRLAAAARASSFRLGEASLSLTAGLTEEGCARLLDDCEVALWDDAGFPPLVLKDAQFAIGDVATTLSGTLHATLTFVYDPAGGVTASARE